MKMRNAVQTIGNLIDKQNVSFISSVDENGYPNTKAMLPPAKKGRNKKYSTLLQIRRLCV